MPTRSRSVDSQQDCANPSGKEQELIDLLLKTRNRRRKNNKPALSRPASFDLVADSAHRFQRSTDDSQPTRRENPRKTERSHHRSLQSFLSRRPKDSAQHSPGSPWHVKDQHRRQQLFLNRRAALYRPSHPIISYSSASSDHSTAKMIKVPSGRCWLYQWRVVLWFGNFKYLVYTACTQQIFTSNICRASAIYAIRTP